MYVRKIDLLLKSTIKERSRDIKGLGDISIPGMVFFLPESLMIRGQTLSFEYFALKKQLKFHKLFLAVSSSRVEYKSNFNK